MNFENFVYWLNGFAELVQEPPNEAQWKSIKDHLSLTLKKVTPTQYKIPLPPVMPQPKDFPPFYNNGDTVIHDAVC